MLGARSIKPYAEYVDTLNDFGKKGGEYGLKVGACCPVLGPEFVGGVGKALSGPGA